MAPVTRTNQKHQDFDADKYVTSTDHEKAIEELHNRLKALEDRFGSNEKIAATLCDAEANAVKMADYLERSFIKLLSKNDPVRTEIKNIVTSIDRGYVQQKLKEYGIWIYGGIVLIVSQLSIETIKWIVSLLHAPVTGTLPIPH